MVRDRILLTCVSLATLHTGCSTVINVRPDEPFDNDRVFNYAQLNSRVERSTAMVFCTDGKVHETFELRVAKDSTYFHLSKGDVAHAVATRDIVRIEQKNYLLGAFTGGGAGLLAGVAVGVPLVLLLNSTSSSGDGPGVGVAFAAAGLGSIVGFVDGAGEGSTTVYQFSPDESSSIGAPSLRKSREKTILLQ